MRLYTPNNVDVNLTPNQQYIIHLLYRKRIYDKRRSDDYVPLMKSLLRDQLGQHSVDKTINGLIADGVVETDGQYVVGYKATGYRLTSKYRHEKHRESTLTDPRLLKRLSKWHARETRVWNLTNHQQILRDMLDLLTIDSSAEQLVEDEYRATRCSLRGIDTGSATRLRRRAKYRYSQSLYAIAALRNREFFLKPADPYGRIHTNLTNLNSKLRMLLGINSKPVVEVDISNSQPLLLGLLFLEKEKEKTQESPTTTHSPTPPTTTSSLYDGNFGSLPSDVRRYLKLCQRGRLYGFVQDQLGLESRSEAKEMFFRLFFGRRRENPLGSLFPSVVDFAREIKRKDHRHLAHALQRREWDIVLKVVSQDLISQGIVHATIHDSILCKAQDADQVQNALMAAFAVHGLKPTLAIKESQQWALTRNCI